MEVEFDKEMDALLRKAGTRGVLVGDKPKVHLDADAIAAFAENAVPEKSRIIYTQHLAECDPCRKTLSNLITLSAAAEPELAAAAAPIVSSLPWYRKLFIAPNLAYIMGGLVLVFGGLFGFIVLQSSYNGDVTVSQVQEPQPLQSATAHTEGSATNASTTAVNSNSVSNVPGEIPRSVGVAEEGLDPNVAGTPPPPAPPSVTTADAIAPTAAPVDSMDKASSLPLMKEAPKVARDGVDLGKKAEEKRADNDQEAAKKDAGYNKNIREQNLQNQSPVQMMPNTQSGPSRNEMQRDNRVYNDDAKLRARQSAPSGGAVSGVRTAGGKKFELKQGAWYDTSYRGQGTKNVRRGTSEYRDLDSGLRTIADGIGGTVVIVWKGKAYRIQ
ncbi:MAG TPA: hypothetical protein VJ781_08350 [Pyrinomonadaceae bacterium]|jgi:hypothetical protein|nr:hypothetical protein [Pyrinomonadaceae bacterium]